MSDTTLTEAGPAPATSADFDYDAIVIGAGMSGMY